MSSKNDFLFVPPNKQHCLLDSSRFRRASSLSRSHRSACSSTSLRPDASSSQNTLCAPSTSSRVHHDSENMIHDGDIDKRSESSMTLFSRSISPSPSANQGLDDISHAYSERTLPPADPSLESPHPFRYPLHEPGQRIAQRTRALRARTTVIVMSLPATVEDIIDFDDDEPARKVSANSASRLRRVSGMGNLRAVFRDHDPAPAPLASSSSREFSKASYELGFLVPPPQTLSPHPSLSTLVDARHLQPQSSGDLKTLCNATLSSVSIFSPSITKFPPPFYPSLSSHTFLPTDKPPSIFRATDPVHNSPIPQISHRIRPASLHHEDVRISPYSGQTVWSCAKISQSAAKRAARRGHHPTKSRVLSNPITPFTLFS